MKYKATITGLGECALDFLDEVKKAGKRISLSGFSCFHAHISSDGAAQITLGIRSPSP